MICIDEVSWRLCLELKRLGRCYFLHVTLIEAIGNSGPKSLLS